MHPNQLMELYALVTQPAKGPDGKVLNEKEKSMMLENMFKELFKGSTAPTSAIIDEIINKIKVLSKLQHISQTLEGIEHSLKTNTKQELEQKRKLNSDGLWRNWVHKYYSRLRKEWNMDVMQKTTDEHEIVKLMDIHKNASISRMKSVNPTFILRNWIAQEVIEAAEKGDNSHVIFIVLFNIY